jgi:hypothetical protein
MRVRCHPTKTKGVNKSMILTATGRDKLEPGNVIRAAGIVTKMELGAGLGLLLFAATVPIATMLWWGRPAAFAEFTTMIFLGIYMYTVITTFAIIFLWGLGRLVIPDQFMRWLGAATIGEIAGLLGFGLQWVLQISSWLFDESLLNLRPTMIYLTTTLTQHICLTSHRIGSIRRVYSEVYRSMMCVLEVEHENSTGFR